MAISAALDARLDAYAQLVIRAGCNLQEGQELFLSCDIACADFARKLMRAAYEAGASDVTLRWSDELCTRMGYEYKPLEMFERFPDWMALLQNGVAKRGAALLFVTSEDPQALDGIDPRKMVAWRKASNLACPDWRNGMDFGRNVWCICGAASPAWAARVFPQLPVDQAVERLWEAILHTVRVDGPDATAAIAAWEAHRASFVARRAWLNGMGLDSLHYRNSLGTDFTVGLLPGGIWQGGGAEIVTGREFFPNMPTEEVFSSPDRNRADGLVVASMPLNHNGALVRNFWIRFEAGRVVDFDAAMGRDEIGRAHV